MEDEPISRGHDTLEEPGHDRRSCAVLGCIIAAAVAHRSCPGTQPGRLQQVTGKNFAGLGVANDKLLEPRETCTIERPFGTSHDETVQFVEQFKIVARRFSHG